MTSSFYLLLKAPSQSFTVPRMEDDVVKPEGVELYDFEDHKTHRGLIFDGLKDEMIKNFPMSHNGTRLDLADVDYADIDEPDFAAQKQSILENKYITRRLRGTVTLTDEATGDKLDEKNVTLMRVPYLTERGTFIHGGNEYASISQSRLLPGAYTRRQSNGELETQFNVRSGSGSAFRVGFEPASSQYRMRVQNANLHLYSLLKDLGIPDGHLEKSWGTEILDANRNKYDSRVLDKAYQRIVSKWEQDPDASKEAKAAAIREAMDRSQIHERVAKRNLPNMFNMAKVAEWREAGEAMEKAAKRKKDVNPYTEEHPDVWRAKSASFAIEDVQALATFLNVQHQAGLDVQAPTDQLEQQIMEFISGTGNTNPAVLAAGIEGLAGVREQMKEASAPEIQYHYPIIPTLIKLARYGAGILFKQPNGKYLLQENQDTDVDDKEHAGKLRPAGGGKHKSDANLKATILREIHEEFGLSKKDVEGKISLLGYLTRQGPYRDCALFQMEDHGLKPGWYQASNSANEKIKLVEADLDDPRYIGPKLTQLRRYALRGYRGRGKSASSEENSRDVTQYEAEGYMDSIDVGLERSAEIDLQQFGEHTDFCDE